MNKARALCLIVVVALGLAAPAAASAWTVKVNANLGCVGRPGPVRWGTANSFTGLVSLNQAQTELSISGWLLNSCPGGRASVYMSWYEGNPAICVMWGVGCYNANDGTAGTITRIVAVGASHPIRLADPSNITVTVCSTYR